MRWVLVLMMALGGVAWGETPARADTPSADEKADKDGTTATPEDPHDVPLPPGYAPEVPQPFLAGPRLYVAQYVALMGLRGLMGWLTLVPVLGLCSVLMLPGLEATAVVYTGDRLGPYRASLLWPWVASYLVNLPTSAVVMVLAVLGQLLMLVAAPFLVRGVMLGTPVEGNIPLVVGGALAAAGGITLALGGLGLVLQGHLASPLATLLAYHLTRKPKRGDDNGSDLPRVFPRGRGLKLPGFLRGLQPKDPGDDDEDDGQSTPVGVHP